MGLLSEGFYSLIFFGEEGWGGYTLNFMFISQCSNKQQRFNFSMFPFYKQVSVCLKIKGFWINWKLDLPPQLRRLGHDEQSVVLKDFLLA